jgi:fumarate reductase flavoprotein subunit
MLKRRDFLKNTAIGAVGVASVGVLNGGGANAANKGTAGNNKATVQTKVTHKPVRTETCDLVVVGSGTAGMCAAVRAAELGASVILLEKLSMFGGTSRFAEGIGGLNSYMHKMDGVKIDINEAVIRCEDYHHWGADARCLQRFLSESGKTIDWLHNNCGVMFLQATVTAPTSYPSWHLGGNDQGKFVKIGEAVLKPLSEYAKKLGVKLRLSNPAIGLIVEDGTIKGVYVNDKKKNEECAIKAKAVVLATGGYANNKEMFERFTHVKYDSVFNYSAAKGRDGDGIRWGEEMGAALHFPGAVMFGVPRVTDAKLNTDKVNFLFSVQPNLRVNERGLRFINEDYSMDFSKFGNVLQTQAKVFSLIDQTYLNMFQNKSVIRHSVIRGYFAGKPMSDAVEVVNKAIEKGQVHKFETVGELAKFIGVDAQTLQNTLDKYNDACAAGKDVEFGKPASMLQPVKTAPYYVAELLQTMFTTIGGLRVDEYFRVTNPEGKPIRGLYAIGNDASSIYGHDYDVGIMSGSQQGWCATGGRLTAEHFMGK